MHRVSGLELKASDLDLGSRACHASSRPQHDIMAHIVVGRSSLHEEVSLHLYSWNV